MATAPGVEELVGRERELAAIEALLERASAGPETLLLDGEPGIGKTVLWRVGLERARAAGFQLLSAQPSEPEAKLTYAGLADLIEPFPDAIGSLPGPQRQSLRIALRLQDVEGPPPDQTAVSLATLNLIRALAADAPVLLAVDDVQWLDAASTDVVAFVIRRLRDEPVGALLTVRGEHPEPRLELKPVELSGLDSHELHRLLRAKLDAMLPLPVVERIREASGGNPLFALEIGRELARGKVKIRPGEPLPVPSTLKRLLEERVGRVSEPARRVMLAVSAAATTREVTLSAFVGDEAAEGVEEALGADLLVREGEDLRFSHPLLRSTVYDLASPSERRLVHRRLAESAVDAEQRARHLALASEGPDAAVADALAAAAAAAVARGAFAAAAELTEQAAQLTPLEERDALWLRRMTASEQHYRSGNFAAARVSVEAALTSASPGEQRALSLFGLGVLETTEQGPARGAEAYRMALREADVSDRWRAEIATSLAHVVSLTEPIDEAVAVAREALEAAERSGERTLLSKALARLAVLQTHAGSGGGGLMERALELEREQIAAGELPEWERVASLHSAEQLIELGEFDRARSLVEDVRDLCRNSGVQLLAWPLGTLAALEQRAGNWTAALKPAVEAVEFAEEVGDTGLTYCRAIKAHVHAARGEAEAARAELDEARRATQPQPDPLVAVRASGFLELSLGNAAEAHQHLSSANRRSLTPSELASSFPDQIEASVMVGELDRAAAELAELETIAAMLDRPLPRACAARCRGMIADASDDRARALEAFEEALRCHDDVDQPFERGRTLLAQGSALRRAKRPRPARAALEQAKALFEETTARPWVGRARVELSRLGGRPTQTRSLTATEQQIAELVATGKSNHEVARTLHVSPKTVEWNLSKVYRKLRVSSRTELAAKLAKRSV